MDKIKVLKKFFKNNDREESLILENINIKEQYKAVLNENKDLKKQIAELQKSQEEISIPDDSTIYNNNIFDINIYNANNGLAENFVKNRKAYFKDCRQTTFVGIPEFDEIFNNIASYEGGPVNTSSNNFFLQDCKLILASGKKCQVSSSFTLGEIKYSSAESIRRCVSIDFANERGCASGIDFNLLDMDWEILTPNSQDSKFAKLITVYYPRYTFYPTIKYYLNKKLIGICFIRDEERIVDHHGDNVYQKSYTGIFNCLPIDNKTLIFDGKLHYFKSLTTSHSSNNYNPLNIFAYQHIYYKGKSNNIFTYKEFNKEVLKNIESIKTSENLSKFIEEQAEQSANFKQENTCQLDIK